MEAVECGSTALGIILEYHGRVVPLAELRHACGVSRHGVNAYEMCRAARRYGLTAKGYKVPLEKLHKLACPFIIHWEFNHFLVVEGVARDGVYVNDPGIGPRKLSAEEFHFGYTGVVLAMAPGPGFEKGGQRPAVWRLLWEPMGRSWPALLYCLLAGLLLIVPGIALPVFSQVFIDSILMENRAEWLRPFLLGMALVLLLQTALQFWQKQCQRRLQVKLAVALSVRFMSHILRLPVGFYEHRASGEISSRSGLNDQVAAFAVGPLANLIIQLLLLLFYAVVMFVYDTLLTGIALLAAVINVWVVGRRVHHLRDFQLRLAQEAGKLGGISIAALQGIESLKASGREDGYFNRWAGGYAKVLIAQQTLERTQLHLGLLPLLLGSLTNTSVLALGGLRVMEGHLSLGMLVAFQSLLLSFQAPLQQLAQLSFQLQQMHVNLTRLDDVHASATDPNTSDQSEPIGSEVPRLSGLVELRHVSFGYSPLDPPLIKDLSLTIKPGQSVALVGASGSGKSTVAKLVAGLYEPWEGEVLFDGQPRQKIPRAVFADCLAYVEQNFAFFSGTVAENLTLWDGSIAPSRLVRSCQEAAIHEVVQGLPGGYSAELLESAGNLSGGEQQRLEIARALLRDPVILILDEVYSALDTETEHRVHRHLRQRGCSCLIIAHRLSTIHDCDEILVLKEGRVVERGRHEDLLKRGGEYARLIRNDEHDEPMNQGLRAPSSRDFQDSSQYTQQVLVSPPCPMPLVDVAETDVQDPL
jgi:ATP-binding cassette subfamily C protein